MLVVPHLGRFPELRDVLLRQLRVPRVDSRAAVALPRVVVAAVVDEGVRVRLPRCDVPVILIVQVVVAVVVQHAWVLVVLQAGAQARREGWRWCEGVLDVQGRRACCAAGQVRQ